MCQTEAQMHVCQALWRHCILVFELGPVQDLTHWRIARILLTGAGEVPGELSSNLYPAPPLKTFFSLVAWNGILWWNFLLLEHSLQFITYADFFRSDGGYLPLSPSGHATAPGGGVLKIATAGNLRGKCLLTPPPGPQHMLFVVTVLIQSQPILAYIVRENLCNKAKKRKTSRFLDFEKKR